MEQYGLNRQIAFQLLMILNFGEFMSCLRLVRTFYLTSHHSLCREQGANLYRRVENNEKYLPVCCAKSLECNVFSLLFVVLLLIMHATAMSSFVSYSYIYCLKYLRFSAAHVTMNQSYTFLGFNPIFKYIVKQQHKLTIEASVKGISVYLKLCYQSFNYI